MVGTTARLRQFEGNSYMLENLKEIRRLKRVDLLLLFIVFQGRKGKIMIHMLVRLGQ